MIDQLSPSHGRFPSFQQPLEDLEQPLASMDLAGSGLWCDGMVAGDTFAAINVALQVGYIVASMRWLNPEPLRQPGGLPILASVGRGTARRRNGWLDDPMVAAVAAYLANRSLPLPRLCDRNGRECERPGPPWCLDPRLRRAAHNPGVGI